MARTHGVWQKRRDNKTSWCFWPMVLTPYSSRSLYCTHVTNVSVYTVTNQPTHGFLTNTTTLFRHIARAAASEDHSRALRASTDRLPVDWRRPRGRPRQSRLRTIDSDLKPLNLGLHSALRRATDRPSWRRIVETAMLFERATWWWWWRWCGPRGLSYSASEFDTRWHSRDIGKCLTFYDWKSCRLAPLKLRQWCLTLYR